MASEWAQKTLSSEGAARGSLDDHDITEILDQAVLLGLRAGLRTGITMAEAVKEESKAVTGKLIASAVALGLLSARGLTDNAPADMVAAIVDSLDAAGDINA